MICNWKDKAVNEDKEEEIRAISVWWCWLTILRTQILKNGASYLLLRTEKQRRIDVYIYTTSTMGVWRSLYSLIHAFKGTGNSEAFRWLNPRKLKVHFGEHYNVCSTLPAPPTRAPIYDTHPQTLLSTTCIKICLVRILNTLQTLHTAWLCSEYGEKTISYFLWLCLWVLDPVVISSRGKWSSFFLHSTFPWFFRPTWVFSDHLPLLEELNALTHLLQRKTSCQVWIP